MMQKKTMNEAISNYFQYVVQNEPIIEHNVIKPKQRAAILAKITTQIADLLAEDQTKIFEAFNRAVIEYDMDGNAFKFPLAIKAVIEPKGAGYSIRNSVSFSLKHSIDVEGNIDETNTPDMFDGDEEEKT